RHSNEVKTGSKQNAENRIDEELHEQVPADAPRRVVERLCHQIQLTESDKPKKTIPQVLPVDQHEHRKNEDNSRTCQQRKERFEKIGELGQFIASGLDDLDGHRSSRGLGRGSLLRILRRRRGNGYRRIRARELLSNFFSAVGG